MQLLKQLCHRSLCITKWGIPRPCLSLCPPPTITLFTPIAVHLPLSLSPYMSRLSCVPIGFKLPYMEIHEIQQDNYWGLPGKLKLL